MTTKIKIGTQELQKKVGQLSFGALLKNIRECEELSQKLFAKRLKISPQRLNDFERGRRLPDIESVVNFARTLKDSEAFFVQILFQDYIHQENLKLQVSVKRLAA